MDLVVFLFCVVFFHVSRRRITTCLCSSATAAASVITTGANVEKRPRCYYCNHGSTLSLLLAFYTAPAERLIVPMHTWSMNARHHVTSFDGCTERSRGRAEEHVTCVAYYHTVITQRVWRFIYTARYIFILFLITYELFNDYLRFFGVFCCATCLMWLGSWYTGMNIVHYHEDVFNKSCSVFSRFEPLGLWIITAHITGSSPASAGRWSNRFYLFFFFLCVHLWMALSQVCPHVACSVMILDFSMTWVYKRL